MIVATLPHFNQRVTARRRPQAQYEAIADNFAGAGGASLGIEKALGRAVDVSINHDSKIALPMHQANHPASWHICQNIWDVDPIEVQRELDGRPFGLAWFSPDCTHFSRAKGGKPVKKTIRSLAWVVIRWAKAVRPRVIMLENVPEFQTWGPLTDDDRPCPRRKGMTFKQWIGRLRGLGYQVEWRELVAADYGVPTIRKRFFLIARCDRRPIVWPKRTHAPRHKAEALGLKPWRAAAECIDWSLMCPSIFERKRPLADATMRRIANGIKRYVIDAAEPFIVCCNHGGPHHRTRSLLDPMVTLTEARDAHGVVAASLQALNANNVPRSPESPLGTVTGSNRHVLVEAFLAKHYGGVIGHDLRRPVGTVTAVDHHSLVSAHLTEVQNASGKSGVRDISKPMPTITACPKGGGFALTSAAVVGVGDRPMPCTTSGGTHIAEVRAFLAVYYGSGSGLTGQSVSNPMPTVCARENISLVTIKGVQYEIADIGLRMLTPRELLRAQFGRFADEYVLIGTKSQQVAAIGNSVPPELAEALVRANVKLQRVDREVAA